MRVRDSLYITTKANNTEKWGRLFYLIEIDWGDC
jgi:hypothetical protein